MPYRSSAAAAGKPGSEFRAAPLPQIKRRYRGCLLGGAVGDALGAPVEFMSAEEIHARFGPAGITDMTTAFDRRGAVTDDTQMTLFTAEALLRAHVQAATHGTTSYTEVAALAYLRWLRTQGTRSPLLEGSEPGWLIEQKELFAQRVPGHTCIASLSAMRVVGARARNESKGCGGVMRVAPVGLFCARAPGASNERAARRAFELGCALAALTHGHPTGQNAAGAFAALVALLVREVPLPEAVAGVLPLLGKRSLGQETLRAIEAAQTQAAAGPGDPARLAKLGEGWVGEEVLAIALYAALTARTFADGVLLAVNHDGDSDSTAAVAGNLLGAIHGIDQVPRHWLSQLELGEVIAAMADDLATYPDWPVGEYLPNGEASAYWLTRYPPG